MTSPKDAWRRIRLPGQILLVGFVASSLLPMSAQGSLSGPFYNDGFEWHGTSSFSDISGDSTRRIDGTVEWAVYAPGTFPYGDYPATAGEYVYAYQITVGKDYSTSVGIGHLSVLLANPADNIGTFSLTLGEVFPTTTVLTPLSAADYDFTPSELPAGSVSSGLAFSSPNAPVMLVGSVLDGGLSDSIDLPSPGTVPEAGALATWLLMGLSSGSVAIGWRRRRTLSSS